MNLSLSLLLLLAVLHLYPLLSAGRASILETQQQQQQREDRLERPLLAALSPRLEKGKLVNFFLGGNKKSDRFPTLPLLLPSFFISSNLSLAAPFPYPPPLDSAPNKDPAMLPRH